MPGDDGVAVETLARVDLKGALVVVAFPTTGQSSSIAAHYLVRHLELPLVGHLRIADLQNVVAIQDGRVTSAVRIFGGEVECRLDGRCPRIYLVMTELALSPPLLSRVGASIIAWAKEGGAHLVLAMEGVVRGEGDTTPDVFCAASDAGILKELRKTGLEPMERALIAGIAARILLLGPVEKVRTGAILVEATRDHPDGRAAAALLEALAKVVPDVKMDFKPLLAEAMQLEEEIRRAQAPTQELPPGTPNSTFI
ncbi:MAG TPA: PAC2 family protein [Candidatus Thermoplasmatota archaeon]|nr:PAC2 family protein [Candidatus Thermoplasmatota archaeon]